MESTLLGLSFGLAAGLSPGPLLTLVVQTSLARGFAAGARVAIAPILTDAPVIALAILFVDALPSGFLRALAIVGGLFVIYLGVSSIKRPIAGESTVTQATARGDVLRACATNLLSPHPWMFWIAVGGPILVETWGSRRPDAIGFLVAFFGLLVGLKVLFAATVSLGREALGSHGHRTAIRVSGALLVGLGVWLLYQGAAGLL